MISVSQTRVAAVVLGFALLLACSSAPSGPAKGTPDFYWQAANETFLAGDYTKTVDNLDSVLGTDNPHLADARPWQLVMLTGMIYANTDPADYFELGGRANKADPAPFRKAVSDYRSVASRYALKLHDAYADFEQKQPDGEVSLAFSYPARGALSDPPALAKVATGAQLADSEAATLKEQMLHRGVLKSVCTATGAPGDGPKASEKLSAAPVKVPRAIFELAMAQALYDASNLYTERKLALPKYQQPLLEMAAKAAAKAPDDNKDAKELRAKIEKETKALSAKH